MFHNKNISAIADVLVVVVVTLNFMRMEYFVVVIVSRSWTSFGVWGYRIIEDPHTDSYYGFVEDWVIMHVYCWRCSRSAANDQIRFISKNVKTVCWNEVFRSTKKVQ